MMMPTTFNPNSIDEALSALNEGHVIAFPTETVYALAADACNPQAVSAIYRLKQRYENKALSLLVHSLEMAHQCVSFTPQAEELAHAFMPGPLTLVLPISPDNSYPITPSLTSHGTLGVRIPNHNEALSLLKAFNKPVVGTSINISGQPPLNDPHDIARLFPEIAVIFEGTTPLSQRASTVVDLTGPTMVILREGAISKDELKGAKLAIPQENRL